ncbi:hypothetical protein BC936DRAFT_146605 [Jimgerdemannia flammicorona]|uniref:Uncharacterized protein n=1 Tax=Jimgerdemannia flammicorona TaxID=994334 RepID=A0A433DLD5_9FUNG|nr:hypothetical protein BC936DRAFT_146605 [Jimgerdemannia flammicorona]
MQCLQNHEELNIWSQIRQHRQFEFQDLELLISFPKSIRQGNSQAIEALCNFQWFEHIYNDIADDTVTYWAFALLCTVFESRESDYLINNAKEPTSGSNKCARNLLMWLIILDFSISSETVDILKWLIESAVSAIILAQLKLQQCIVYCWQSMTSDVTSTFFSEHYQRMPMPTNAILSNSQVSEDNEKTFYLLMSHACYQRLLSTCYAYGIGTEQDNDQAFDLFSQSAEDGDKLVMQILEQWDEKKAERAGDDDKVEMNLNKVFRLVLLAAKGDNPEAQNSLGGCSARGKGTEIHESVNAMNSLWKAYEEGYREIFL